MLRKLPIDGNVPLTQVISVINALVEGLTLKHIYIPHEAEPDDKVDGMVVYADGTNWNPGAGAGIYWYIGGTWTKMT